MAYRFEPLSRQHDRAGFRCASGILSTYLQQFARKDADRRIAATFVMVDEKEPAVIVGYYTLSAFTIELAELPETIRQKLPRYPKLPATLLGRLARDERFPGTGSLLLIDALKRAFLQSTEIASLAVVAEAKDDKAMMFYHKFGFANLGLRANRVFLPMGTIQKVLQRSSGP